jgi:hypothetical protein
MKRLVLIAALGVATIAHAQDADIKNSGEFRLRYENEQNRNGAESHDAGFTHRFKWNITARKGENLQAMLGLVHNAMWGYGTAAGEGSDVTATPNGLEATGENALLVNRAWGWWKSSDALSFKFGRMGIEIADGAVFSENDWQAVPTAHEGVMGMWDMDFAKIGLFGVKNVDVTFGTADTERNIYGVSLDLKNMPEAIKTANVLILQDSTDAGAPTTPAATNSVSRQHLGATVAGDVHGFMYKGTVGYQMGKIKAATSTDINAMMYDLMLGYGLQEVMGLKVSAGYHSDTGDKASTATKSEAYNPMFYDRHNYGGLMDVLNWGNLTYWNVNATLMPMETIEAGVGYYMFSKTEASAGTNMGNNTGLTTPAGASKELGSEVDVFANKAYDNGMKIGVRYSSFMLGKAWKDAGVTKSPSDIFVQASLSF